jgi:aspartate 1-decarboxylase
MLRTFMRAKIHRATVTDANVDYMGSITLDSRLMKAAGLLPLEQVDVLNVSNGNRLTTYCLEGKAGSGEVCVNGAAALLCRRGDIVLIVAFAQLEEAELSAFRAKTVFVDARNRPTRTLLQRAAITGRPAPKRAALRTRRREA